MIKRHHRFIRSLQRFILLVALLFSASFGGVEAQVGSKEGSQGFLGFAFDYFEDEVESVEVGRLRVVGLMPDRPAAKADLREGDVIVAVNGASFRFTSELEVGQAFDWLRAGDTVTLSVLRDGAALELQLIAAEMPEAACAPRPR